MPIQEPMAVATLKVVQPGGGRAGRLGPGVGVHFKIDGADTGGTLSVVEHPFDVGALVRPHVHTREDEVSIVLEGKIGFRSEDQEVVLEPGGYIIKPRNQVHAMWNAGSTAARMIEIISPAGFEGFFRGFADMNDTGPIDLAAVQALAADYGLPYAEPTWLPDVIARYNLTQPQTPPRRSGRITSRPSTSSPRTTTSSTSPRTSTATILLIPPASPARSAVPACVSASRSRRWNKSEDGTRFGSATDLGGDAEWLGVRRTADLTRRLPI